MAPRGRCTSGWASPTSPRSPPLHAADTGAYLLVPPSRTGSEMSPTDELVRYRSENAVFRHSAVDRVGLPRYRDVEGALLG